MRKIMIRSVAITATAVGCLVGTVPSWAAVKLIGDFEGTLASPYTTANPIPATANGGCAQAAGTVNWCADGGIVNAPDAASPGIGVPPEFIDLNDPADAPYWDAVTHGTQALKFTFPGAWGSIQGPYLRLHGQSQLLDDTRATGFQFLAFDVTTWGGYDEPPDPLPGPETGPYKQVHTVFNGDVIGFYGKEESGDDDVQISVDYAAWNETSKTTTIIQDLTGPLPPFQQGDANNDPDDGKIAINQLAGFEDPNAVGFAYQLVLVFQGRDYPPPSGSVWLQTVGLDNFRFCDTAAECAAPPTLIGDYNNDHTVNAADYTVWRNGLGGTTLTNETASPGIVDGADYTAWKGNFGAIGGSGAGGAAGVAAPEPSSIVMILGAVVALFAVGGLRR